MTNSIIRKLFFSFFFLIITLSDGYTQIQRSTIAGFLVGFNIGANNSKFKIDSVIVEPALLPSLGLNIEKKFLPYLAFRFSTAYVRRGTNSDNELYEYRNNYFDMQLQARLLAGDYLKFSLGFQRSGLLSSRVKVYPDRFSVLSSWEKTTGFSNQYQWNVGVSSAIVNGFDIELNYVIPSAKHDYHCLQFSINLYPGQLKRKKRIKKFTSIADAMVDPYLVEKLVLHRQKLEEIPWQVYTFTNLKILVLDGNKIDSISPNIKNLTNLEQFSIQYNIVSELPSEIGNLKNLKELRLNRNQLKRIPPEIGLLTNLQFLYIGKNNLQSLPTEISMLESLIELDIAQSGVMLSLPNSIQNLRRLEVLYIDKTTILPYSLSTYNKRLKIIYK